MMSFVFAHETQSPWWWHLPQTDDGIVNRNGNRVSELQAWLNF